VVFNEMKGVYSSPSAVLGRTSARSLYPDTTYGVDSGGDPRAIPDLTYAEFKAFHARHYHPSNARVVFYGDDDPAERLNVLEGYLSQFERIDPDAGIALQPRFTAPRKVFETYAASGEEADNPRSGMVTVNWMLDEIGDPAMLLTLNVLESILVGTPAAPLRKAMIDSGLGEGMTGSGFADGLKQPYFTFGLKGVDPANADRVEALIVETLGALSRDGIDRDTVEAALNSAEFALRENNTGSFPRGIALMFRSMGTWLYGGDPMGPLKFEAALTALKADVAAGRPVFEDLIRTHLVDNVHRTTVLLTADPEKAAREEAAERARLDAVQAALDPAGLAAVAQQTGHLKALQEEGDSPEALSKIPTLTREDLPRSGVHIPIERESVGVPLYTHDLATNGIVYLDFGFDLKALPERLLPYLPIFTRSLTQTGTHKEDFVSLTHRIGRLTGGIGAAQTITARRDGAGTVTRLFLRTKAVPDRVEDLLGIVTDVLTDARLDNFQRIRQMVLESKAGFESSLAGMGNSIAAMRLKAGLNEGDWLVEKLGGVSQYFFMRELSKRVDADWPAVEAALEEVRATLLGRAAMVINLTTDAAAIARMRPLLETFVSGLPAGRSGDGGWGFAVTPVSEGLTFPGQVNYVAKGADLKALGFKPSGASAVAVRHLNTTYLWDKIRVQGGAYGGGSGLDAFSGAFTFTSYRDPNLVDTLRAYDGAATFLRQGIGEQDLTRSIIGVIGAIDAYRLPDAKGFSSLLSELTGDTEEARQERRDEVLSASAADFSSLADALEQVARQGQVVVLGSDKAIRAANDEAGGFLKVTKVL
jgi:Zn-dependent M16 (insulinase) family peptidase